MEGRDLHWRLDFGPAKRGVLHSRPPVVSVLRLKSYVLAGLSPAPAPWSLHHLLAQVGLRGQWAESCSRTGREGPGDQIFTTGFLWGTPHSPCRVFYLLYRGFCDIFQELGYFSPCPPNIKSSDSKITRFFLKLVF